jgi:hypothetical protein
MWEKQIRSVGQKQRKSVVLAVGISAGDTDLFMNV